MIIFINDDLPIEDISAPGIALRAYLNEFTSRASLPESVYFPCTAELDDEFTEWNSRDGDDIYVEVPDCNIG